MTQLTPISGEDRTVSNQLTVAPRRRGKEPFHLGLSACRLVTGADDRIHRPVRPDDVARDWSS